ncbi:MAG: ComF family protein [Bacteroidales bacterium]|nr:ComF family protein [Bacteroidales bacterium]
MKAPRRHPFRPLHDLWRILLPHLCIHCGEPLVGDEQDLCTQCLMQTAWLTTDTAEENTIGRRLAGRIPFEAAAALMAFRKDTVVQSVVHHIKYYHNTRLAAQYGRLMGEMLIASGRFAEVDCLVPVPLHPLKHLRRGYNQSQLLCEAIAHVMHLPIESHTLYRRRYTQTQTHKNHQERQDNMQGVFALRHPERLAGKHILLVDDIVTTGATTTACYDALAAIPGLHISIATLAVAAD